jgi:protein-arginine kinase activator protein McsA
MGSKKKEAKDKPLDKMTAKELREIAKEISGITGVHGMNKIELVSAVKKARGIVETPGKSGADDSVRTLKKKIRVLKAARQEALTAQDLRKATVARRRISRLKKRTRKAV